MSEPRKFGPDELGNQQDPVYRYAHGGQEEIKLAETFEDVKASKQYREADEAGKIELFHAWKMRDDARRAAMRRTAQQSRLGSAAPMERQIFIKGAAPESVKIAPPMPGSDAFKKLGFEEAQAALGYWAAKGVNKRGEVVGRDVRRVGHRVDRSDASERPSASI